jgi:hypothetical protein
MTYRDGNTVAADRPSLICTLAAVYRDCTADEIRDIYNVWQIDALRWCCQEDRRSSAPAGVA